MPIDNDDDGCQCQLSSVEPSNAFSTLVG